MTGRWSGERLALRMAVALAAIVPVAAGGAGAIGLLDPPDGPLASHVRYLSGLLLAAGVLFWIMVPRIERYGREVRCLTFLVLVGGLARLAGAVATQGFSPVAVFALVMELLVTPALCLWQGRLEGRYADGL